MDGTFRCHRWNGPDALLNQRVCRLVNFHKDIEPSFVFYAINEHLRRIETDTRFSTVKHISAKQIRKHSRPFPRSICAVV